MVLALWSDVAELDVDLVGGALLSESPRTGPISDRGRRAESPRSRRLDAIPWPQKVHIAPWMERHTLDGKI